jgi:hypothetical protein
MPVLLTALHVARVRATASQQGGGRQTTEALRHPSTTAANVI